MSNSLKAISQDDLVLRVTNYIVLFGDPNHRDLQGVAHLFGNQEGDTQLLPNPDGSLGEYFTPDTVLKSLYTIVGFIEVDWEHGTDSVKGAPGSGEVLGVVDWSTATADDQGVRVVRDLYKSSVYFPDILEWIDLGLLGTSSQAIKKQVEKARDGRIVRWPIERDTLTITPMEPRMLDDGRIRVL